MRCWSGMPAGLVLMLVGVLIACGPTSAQSELPRFEVVADGDAFPLQVSGPRFQRGYLVVAQDADAPGGLELRLPVVRVRAIDPEPGLAPVVFLPGGPGEGGLSAAQYSGAYPWTQTRDFIVFGRRGTRFAEPSLQCAAIGPALAATGEDAQTALFEALDTCKRDLVAQGVDFNHYHSAASARDLEALREVFGDEQLALFALSYGTRLALTYARDFPGRVEAMVLDSPLPHTSRFDDEYAENLEAALRRATELCAADAECERTYPAIGDRFFRAVDEATQSCASDTGEGAICGSDLVGRVPLYSAQTLAEVPYRMEQALQATKPLAPDGAGSDFDWGVRLSVWCSEALPYAERAQGLDPDRFAGLDSAVFRPEVCERWGVETRTEFELEPTVSDVPALVIAGEFDALTPPRWGAQAAGTLSQSRVITIPAGFHSETTNWGGDGCAMSLAAAFFEAPAALISNASVPECIQARTYPEFRGSAG